MVVVGFVAALGGGLGGVALAGDANPSGVFAPFNPGVACPG